MNRLHTKVFEAASDVFSEIGPGLDDQIYKSCLMHELRLKGLMFKRDVAFPVFYKDIKTNHEIKAEILVENQMFIELTNSPEITLLMISRLQSKLKIAGKRLGVIISFNVNNITEGYRKVVVNQP
ncbi:MAG TPA: GxxExxY protein [Lentimicrobium sp.]|nr:GxxExxY protein [Lentimicrobium sp.]